MNCVACGLELETHEYQSRAADEAHTSVTTCAKCPVDAIKLNPVDMPGVPYRGLKRPIKRPLHVRACSAGSRLGSVSTIIIDVPRSHEYYTTKTEHDHITVTQRVLSTTEGGASLEKNGVYTITGPLRSTCTSEIRHDIIGMGISLVEYGTFTPASVGPAHQRIVSGTYSRVTAVAGLESYIYHASGSNNRKLIVVLPEQHRRNKWMEVVNSAMLQHLLPESALRYIKNDIAARLSNLSARAWDATSPPEVGHTFTCKPDGQRKWLVLYGKVWYMMSPRFKGNVQHWYISQFGFKQTCDDIVVIDVEYLGRHGFVLIDVLTSCDGVPSPVSRDMNWVINQMHHINDAYHPPRVNIRQYFKLHSDAALYSSSVLYPTDGVVAIRDGSTEMLKIKHIKSMELRHVGDGVLVTAEEDVVAKSSRAALFDIDDIVEVRFTVDSKTRKINVTDIFVRVDKTIANSTAAVTNIITSGFKLETKDDNDRRAALLWCNELRRAIHRRALSRNDNRNIVLDIGSGDGQSLDSMMANQSTSCIYVEPDFAKCARLAWRLKTKKVYNNPADIIPMIRSLKTRLTNSVVLNCSLRDIIDCDGLLVKLVPELRCITCTFSMHFVTDELQDISAACSVPMYGCGYMYDNVDENGILIDTSGVTMKQVDDETALVKWGNDKEYNEPMTTTLHYSGLGRTVRGADVLQLPDVNVNPHAVDICSNVYVLMP